MPVFVWGFGDQGVTCSYGRLRKAKDFGLRGLRLWALGHRAIRFCMALLCLILQGKAPTGNPTPE